MRIPTPLIFSLTVTRYELITDLGFSAKGYGDILLRRIGGFHPKVIYACGRKCFFSVNLLKVNFQHII